MSDKTTIGRIAKKAASEMQPPTAPDSNGKSIMSRREASLLVVILSALGGGGTYMATDAKVAKAQGVNEQKVEAMEEDIYDLKNGKADNLLVNERFNNYQNQMNNIEVDVDDLKGDVKDIKAQTSETYTAVQVLLERIPVK